MNVRTLPDTAAAEAPSSWCYTLAYRGDLPIECAPPPSTTRLRTGPPLVMQQRQAPAPAFRAAAWPAARAFE